MSQFSFDITILDQLFPFFFIVDERGRFSRMGRSLQKLSQRGHDAFFHELFQIVRPAGADFQVLTSRNVNEMINLQMLEPRATLMGQVLSLNESQHKLFVVNLVVQDADELTDLNLDFNDFAIQDPIFDYLMLLQTQRRAIRHADELNKKLEKARQVAIQASETKSQFLANMSHEMRTPLNGLIAMSSILLETELDVDQKDYVQTLMTSGEALLALVNDILDLSKIEAGFIQLEPTDFQIVGLFKEVQDAVSPLAKKKNLSLDFQLESSVPQWGSGDRGRLRQVILNLVGNAVKFTEQGFIQVWVEAETIDETSFELKVRIRDSGIGMNDETLSQIFSPFVQGDSSMTKKFEGTGLGLSICKKLVQAMKGKISVESKEGQGSIFTVTVILGVTDLTK